MVRVKHGVAVLHTTVIQRLRHGAVRSVSGNPFLRWQTTSFGMEATVNFSVAGQVYRKRHTMISGTVPGIFPGIFPVIALGFLHTEAFAAATDAGDAS